MFTWQQARAAVGDERLVGLSTHSPAQIEAAAYAGVDYIGVGPVHATPTKPGRPAVGLDLVPTRRSTLRSRSSPSEVSTRAAWPPSAGRAATRVAVVRALTEAADPEGGARRAARRIAERTALAPRKPSARRKRRSDDDGSTTPRSRRAVAERRAEDARHADGWARPGGHACRLARRARDDPLPEARRRGPRRADPDHARRAAGADRGRRGHRRSSWASDNWSPSPPG